MYSSVSPQLVTDTYLLIVRVNNPIRAAQRVPRAAACHSQCTKQRLQQHMLHVMKLPEIRPPSVLTSGLNREVDLITRPKYNEMRCYGPKKWWFYINS